MLRSPSSAIIRIRLGITKLLSLVVMIKATWTRPPSPPSSR